MVQIERSLRKYELEGKKWMQWRQGRVVLDNEVRWGVQSGYPFGLVSDTVDFQSGYHDGQWESQPEASDR